MSAPAIPISPLPSLAERDAWRALYQARDAYDAAVLDRTMAIKLLDEMVENRAREYRAAQAHAQTFIPASPDVPGVSAVSSSEQTTESRGQTLAPAPAPCTCWSGSQDKSNWSPCRGKVHIR